MMKRLILAFALITASAAAQTVLNGSTNWAVVSSAFPPDPSTCRELINVGSIFIQTQNPDFGPVRVLRCAQTGATEFTWQPIGHTVGNRLPDKCAVGEFFFRTGVAAGQNIYGCTSPNTWTAQAGGGGGGGNPGGITGQIQFNAAGAFGGLTLPVGIVKGSAGPALIAATPGSDYELPLTFGSGLSRTSNEVTIPAAGVSDTMLAGSIGTSKLATRSGNGPTVATTTGTLTSGHCTSIDAAGNLVDAGIGCASGSGITTLNGLTSGSAPSQTFAKTDDTNVTIGISSSGTAHTFAMGWTGRLAKSRQSSATAYTDASNSFVSTQDFGSADFLRIPTLAGYTPTLAGHVGYDLTANSYVGFTNAKKTFAFLDSNITGTAANVSGTPALPNGTSATTQTVGDSTTKLATTAFTAAGLALRAPLASPGLTGVPTSPTAAAGTNNTQIATTGYIDGARVSTNPTTAYDAVTVGSELISNSGITTTGWTGSYPTFTHTTGNTSALTYTPTITSATMYQVRFTVAGRTAGSVTVAIGGSPLDSNTGNGSVYITNTIYTAGVLTASTAALTFTPSTDFDGSIGSVSVKPITATMSALTTVKDSTGFLTLGERRNAGLGNVFDGYQAGQYNVGNVGSIFLGYQAGSKSMSTIRNIFIGYQNGLANWGGWDNAIVGGQSFIANTYGVANAGVGTTVLLNNTIGSHNSAFGDASLPANTTGNSNSALGASAGTTNTVGFNNLYAGLNAGGYQADGTSAVTGAQNSSYIGSGTRASGSAPVGETVVGAGAIGNGSGTATIGSASTTDTYLAGTAHATSFTTGGPYSAGGAAVTLSTGTAASRGACSTAPIAWLATDTHALTVCNTSTSTWGTAINPSGSYGEIFNLGSGKWECYKDDGSSCAPAGGSVSYAYHSYTGTSAVDFSLYNNVLVTASGGNVTVTVSATPASSGSPVQIGLCNDGTARTWTLPATFKRILPPLVLSTCSYTNATYDGTNYQGPGSDETPSILRYTTERAITGAGPACGFDSTSHQYTCVNASSVASNTVVPKTATTHQFVTAIGADGVVTQAAIGATDIPNIPVTISTSGPVSDPGGANAYLFNNAAGALTFNLPDGVAGLQRCYRNATGKTGAITIAVTTSNAIDYNGANGTTTTGTLVSGGALGDSVCLAADAIHHWYAYAQKGTWTNN